ncbi:MAG: DNA repair protein RadA [Melioribacteraceae bacterium]|nr:DNA repair protein RadA [Melioribacteraceae bacterium]
MSKVKLKYICTECGYESLKWLGKCPSCEAWNSFTEEFVETGKSVKRTVPDSKIVNLSDEVSGGEARIKTNISEFDRVLGGGITTGSVVLIGGDPGIGKSTLVMQAASTSDSKVLYVTGEESISQINGRALRLKINSQNVFVLAETDLDVIINSIEKIQPEIVIIDSIQTISKSDLDNAPGTITQIRECASHLMQVAKSKNVSIILIGHVTKEGFIAGPKVLEHVVDTVLQFEGDKNHTYRILRAQKNRFGSTNEIGIFEMHDTGLNEVKNPSEIFLSEHNRNITGSVVTASIEGTRAVLLEVQALVTPSNYGNPQRVATGFDYRRLSILLAVLEKRAKLRLSNYNVFLNMAGGLRIEEPAVDLAVCTAIASSYKDRPVRNMNVVVGEVGLGGEVRAVANIDKRIQESIKLGFKEIILPDKNLKVLKNFNEIKLINVKDVSEALDLLIK